MSQNKRNAPIFLPKYAHKTKKVQPKLSLSERINKDIHIVNETNINIYTEKLQLLIIKLYDKNICMRQTLTYMREILNYKKDADLSVSEKKDKETSILDIVWEMGGRDMSDLFKDEITNINDSIHNVLIYIDCLISVMKDLEIENIKMKRALLLMKDASSVLCEDLEEEE